MDHQMCQNCSNLGFDDGDDGFFYCRTCGSKADDIIDTAVADEDFVGDFGSNHGALYSAAHRRANVPIKAEPISQSHPSLFHSHLFQTLDTEDDDKKAKDRVFENDTVPFRGVKKEEFDDDGGDGIGPIGPSDFAGNMGGELSYDDYYNEVRIKYVLGMQMMVQMQCEALVEKFGVSPLVCGLVGSIWLRLVGVSRVFDEGWADEAIHESESQKEGEAGDFKPRAKFRAEPHNIHGERAVMIWFRSLRKYSEDLPSYLQYCKDVLFAGCEPSYDDREEEKLVEQLLDFYQNHKDERVECCGELGQKRLTISDDDSSEGSLRGQDSTPGSQAFAETLKDEAIKHLKCNMEESRFRYIPPRVKIKRCDYLHYVRKKDDGALNYVAHADYYILLRACATAAQVDIRIMHMGVLSFERRLGWIENRIDHCLNLKPPNLSCEYCSNTQEDATEDEDSI
ncbi:hypothetical protein RJ641_012528, partial [Dillenia turbinata]